MIGQPSSHMGSVIILDGDAQIESVECMWLETVEDRRPRYEELVGDRTGQSISSVMGEEGKGTVWMDESLTGGREGWGVPCADRASFSLIVFSWVVRSVCLWRSIDRSSTLCAISLSVTSVGNFPYFFKAAYSAGMLARRRKRTGSELGGRRSRIWYLLKCFCSCWSTLSTELKAMKLTNMTLTSESAILTCSSSLMPG